MAINKEKLSLKHPSTTPVRLLSMQAAAALLSISYWTVRNLIWGGDLPCVRVGRRILIDRQDLETFIAENKQVESA